MLRPAHVVDLPILRALIREGALSGSFDRVLATESREAALFFTNLRQALASGYFVEAPAPGISSRSPSSPTSFVRSRPIGASAGWLRPVQGHRSVEL
jgi:hypothetical protein